MNNITIIAVGNIKENYFREAADEYLKRISPYAAVTVRELKEEKLPDRALSVTAAEIKKALQKEGNAIIGSLPKNAYVISLCVEGVKYSSEQFAGIFGTVPSGRNIVFIIGSSHGLSDDVKEKFDLKLSFSDMTFPHRLMRVILCEQLYRAFTIINNGKYHK
ncbi:MAG: 23S rRNA (pseudouridine(1915)-N(3))-methyltransferase RlmH [Eubacteriales bacterium]|nr:23S rRNA (pseudouridine(1915)-N(3))-methyltransferase RlmH [Eubacteriales bacterium]